MPLIRQGPRRIRQATKAIRRVRRASDNRRGSTDRARRARDGGFAYPSVPDKDPTIDHTDPAVPIARLPADMRNLTTQVGRPTVTARNPTAYVARRKDRKE